MLERARAFFGQRFAVSGAIDYPIYGLLGISIVLTSVLTATGFEDNSRTLSIVFANIFAVGAVFVMLVVIDRSLQRFGTELKVSLGALVLGGAAAGVLKGFLTWLGLLFLGYAFDTLPDFIARLGFSAITGLIVVPAVALFGSLKYRYAQQREALISEKVASAEGENYPATLIRFVSDAKQRIAKSGKSLDQKALVDELRDIVNSDLRPLSQEIWRRESLKFPSFKLSQMAKIAIRGHVYSVTWVVPLWAITTLTATIRVFSVEEGLLIQVVRSLLMLVGLVIARRIPVRTTAGALAVYLTAMFSIGFAQVSLGTFLSDGRSLGDDIGFMIANLIWLFQLTLFIGMAKAFLELGQKVESEFERFLDASDLEELKRVRELALKERQLAQFLHGHMQSKLNGVAARIETRVSSSDLSEDIDQIEQVLNEALVEFGKQQATSIEEVIKRLEIDWGGMVQLTFAISPTPLNQKQLEDVSQVISEGIANAVRHGFASRVSVTLDEGLELRISDDGTGPRAGVPGLGSTFFDSVSRDWELTDTGAGSLLRVKLD